jgi:two-component system chemotaxis response regulator CheY
MKLYQVAGKKSNISIKQQILIIDSEWNMLKLLYALLSQEFDVVVKTSSVDALHWLVNGKKPALIITEYKLPRIDGVLFIKHLRFSGLYSDIPVIILSDAHDLENKTNGLPFFTGAVISKPFNPSYLVNRINFLIDEYKSTVA